jgi:DnaJ-class molecular chaperone
MNPYETLGIGKNSDDQAIRQAYLELVKQYPPDRAPERFKEIANAYDAIKDEKKRWELYLFDKEIPFNRPMEALKMQIRRGKRKPPAFDILKELLKNA